MKKYLSILVMALMMILPINVHAEVESHGLADAFSAEGITADLSDYKESTEKINIYMFRQDGCVHCQGFLTYLSTILPEYGKYFNLVAYKINGNADNSALLDTVGEFLNIPTSSGGGYGVPMIIIGEKYFHGYGSSYDSDILEAIVELYNSEDRYDVFEEMQNPSTNSVNSEQLDKIYNNIISWMLIISIICFIGYIIKSNADKKEILSKLGK